jgi:hypothetical protein
MSIICFTRKLRSVVLLNVYEIFVILVLRINIHKRVVKLFTLACVAVAKAKQQIGRQAAGLEPAKLTKKPVSRPLALRSRYIQPRWLVAGYFAASLQVISEECSHKSFSYRVDKQHIKKKCINVRDYLQNLCMYSMKQ